MLGPREEEEMKSDGREIALIYSGRKTNVQVWICSTTGNHRKF